MLKLHQHMRMLCKRDSAENVTKDSSCQKTKSWYVAIRFLYALIILVNDLMGLKFLAFRRCTHSTFFSPFIDVFLDASWQMLTVSHDVL